MNLVFNETGVDEILECFDDDEDKEKLGMVISKLLHLIKSKKEYREGFPNEFVEM